MTSVTFATNNNLPKESNSLTPKARSKGPRSEHSIELQTVVAQELFYGKWKDNRYGLVQFAKFVNQIYQAASQDDPYADLFLLRIYEALCQTKHQFKKIENRYQPLLSSTRGVKLTVESRRTKLKLPLKFSTPYSFMAAFLLADFDYLLRLLKTFEKTGIIIDKEPNDIRREVVKLMQRVFSTPFGWSHTGVKRSGNKYKISLTTLSK